MGPWGGALGGLEQPIWLTGSLLFGLVAGSFTNVCIHRLPRGQSIVTPGSRCPRCDTALRAWHNVPLLSYALLRGRCATCGVRISARYPLVEAANGLAWLAVAALFPPGVPAIVKMGLVSALLTLAVIDAEHYMLPDAITRPGIVAGIGVSFFSWTAVGPFQAALTAAGGYGAFGLVARAYRRTRGVEGLGRGDWKMAAMLGAFLGWQKLLLVVLVASIVGTLVGLVAMAVRGKHLQHALPLGTFLGLAGVAVVLVGDPILAWYRGLFPA